MDGGVALGLRELLRGLLLAACCAGTTFVVAQAPKKPAVEEPRFEIRRFIFEGATLIPQAQLEEATRQFTGPGRGFGDVQRALEVLERMYSQAGWSAVQVLLPEQELERGEVRFQFIEAKLARVIVEGNKFFDEANIRASVPSLVPGQSPNINRIARDLRVANESPAKQTNVLLRSGQQEATVDAVVRVVDEKFRRGSVTVDSSGTQETGKFRVGFGFQHGNVFNRDHVLTLQYVTAPHRDTHPHQIDLFPGKQVFILGAGYRIPLYERGDALDFTAGYSNVSSGQVANFQITGVGGIFGARYTRNFDRVGDYEHRMIFSWDYRGYQNKGVRAIGGTNQIVRDVAVHPIGVLYSGVIRRQDSETGFAFGASQNIPGGNDGSGADFCAPLPSGALPTRLDPDGNCSNARYFIWRWALSHNMALGSDWQARFAMNGQFTRDTLIAAEQFGIGGADSVRGFLEREVVNDNGYRGTLELYTPDFGGRTGIEGARMRGVLFADWGGVRRNRPAGGDLHSQHVGSYGFGIRFSRGTNLSLRMDYATVWDQGGNQGRNDGRLHASVSYVF